MPSSELKGSHVDSPNRRTGTFGRFLSPRGLMSFLTTRHLDLGLERYRRVGITASSLLLAKALAIVIAFVSVPLTVNFLGVERYGVWLTMNSLVAWLALTNS